VANFQVKFDNYIFTYPDSLMDNFKNLVPNTVRMPGVSGGFDQYGSEAAPAEIGRVDVGFHLQASNPAQMQGLIDAVNALKWRGKKRLFWQPEGAYQERWCWARVNNISLPQSADDGLMHQTGRITFQVSDPRWYSKRLDGTTGSALWKIGDTGVKIGDAGLKIDGVVDFRILNGLTNSFSVTVEGTDIVLPRLTLQAYYPTSDTATNITVQRLVGGTVVDSVLWTGTLINKDWLEIDCARRRVRNMHVDDYAHLTALHPSWLRLTPGSNTLRVLMTNASDRIYFRLHFHDPYS
jgi:hypothetical protein